MTYSDRFITLVEQDIQPAPQIPDGSPERDAMEKTLDKGITPEDYDVPVPQISQRESLKQQQLEHLKEWIAKVDNFVDFLNAPNPESLQSQLHAAGCDSIFDAIARSEKKKIARLAADLSSLSESFKGYLISAHS